MTDFHVDCKPSYIFWQQLLDSVRRKQLAENVEILAINIFTAFRAGGSGNFNTDLIARVTGADKF